MGICFRRGVGHNIMDKGIFYLICTLVIVGAVLVTGGSVNKSVAQQCTGKTVYVQPTVTVAPTVEPTATPSALLKSSVKKVVTVAPTVKAK